jgi:hypothetical protein
VSYVLTLLLVAMNLQPAVSTAEVRVNASTDRPAIWIADRVTYTIEVTCPRGVDILSEDFDRDRLKLTGLEVVSADTRRTDALDGVRYAFTYVLTTYRADVASPTIEGFPVRYYLTRPGQRAEDAAPAGTVMVPPVAIAFRSLLADDRAGYEIRDRRALPTASLPNGALLSLGAGLMLLSAAPLALLLARAARTAHTRRRAPAGRSMRHARQEAHAALAELRALDAADPGARREGFARLDSLVRDYVADAARVPARSMTAADLAGALDRGSSRIPPESLAAVLEACEVARFAPDRLQPSRADWDAALEQAERVTGDG